MRGNPFAGRMNECGVELEPVSLLSMVGLWRPRTRARDLRRLIAVRANRSCRLIERANYYYWPFSGRVASRGCNRHHAAALRSYAAAAVQPGKILDTTRWGDGLQTRWQPDQTNPVMAA